MARTKVNQPPQRANLSLEDMKLGITRLKRRIKDLENFDPNLIEKRWAPEVDALQKSIKGTLIEVFGHDTVEYNLYGDAARLDNGPVTMSSDFYPSPREDHQQYLTDGKKASLLLLNGAVQSLEEKIGDCSNVETDLPQLVQALSHKVFLVHGRDDGTRETVARFLEQLGLDPIILHEQPNKGRTIITKFQEEASDIGFAIVLMTPDDFGGKSGEEPKPRARQNVIFELGFFIGKLGPQRVAALVKGNIEHPSDYDGVVYISLDDNQWKIVLGRELKAAGYKIDFNKFI